MKYIQLHIDQQHIDFYKRKAAEKIYAEGWIGRNRAQKARNFVNCWITEEAFKHLLIKKKAFFRHRSLYVGDAAGAGADFEVKQHGKWKTVGIRSVNVASLLKWKSVTYPEDRFLKEPHRIPDFIVGCHNKNGCVMFFGTVDKATLLCELGKSVRKMSKTNQEWFRKIGIEKFCYDRLAILVDSLDKR
jgi:hypothetical protein